MLRERDEQRACPRFSIVFLAAHDIERNKTISSLAWFKQKAALHIVWQRLLADTLYRYVKIGTTRLGSPHLAQKRQCTDIFQVSLWVDVLKTFFIHIKLPHTNPLVQRLQRCCHFHQPQHFKYTSIMLISNRDKPLYQTLLQLVRSRTMIVHL